MRLLLVLAWILATGLVHSLSKVLLRKLELSPWQFAAVGAPQAFLLFAAWSYWVATWTLLQSAIAGAIVSLISVRFSLRYARQYQKEHEGA